MQRGRCSSTGKVVQSKEAAHAAKRRLKNGLLNVYQCAACGGWHTGRSSEPTRNSDRIGDLLRQHDQELQRRLRR